MALKQKSSLAEINKQLIDKRREDYGIGAANLAYQAGSNKVVLSDGALWDKMEKSTTRRTKFKWYNWMKWLLSKKNKVGRFGQKSVSNKAIEIMADQIEIEGEHGEKDEYFDPMQSMYLDGAAYEKGSIGEEFHNLVTDEANLAQENDFHSELTEGGKGYSVLNNMALHVDKKDDPKEVIKLYVEDYQKRHDVTKAFKPDGGVVLDGQPDNFAISVGVVGASRYYMEYTTESAKQKGVEKILNALGSKSSSSKEEQENKLIQSAMEKTPLYKKLVEEGKKNDENYNPDNDPLIENLRAEIKYQKNMGSPGHAFIRLIPKMRNIKKATYSFGFCTTGPGKIGGVDEGTVANPDPRVEESSKTEKEYQIPYSGYLKAAAKIRGIMASGRKYSVLGYNCTSFAVEVAKSAGVSISDEEVATDMTTFDSRAERVDIPAALQNFLFKERAKANEDAQDERLKNSYDKATYEKWEKDYFDRIEQQRKNGYIEKKRAQWYGLIKNNLILNNIYKDKDEKIYQDIFESMERIAYGMDEEMVKTFQEKYNLDFTKNTELTPCQFILDFACKNVSAFRDLLYLGVELPMLSPINYADLLERKIWENGNSEQYADIIMNNQYFPHDVGCELTKEQALDVLKKILDYEKDIIYNLAYNNGIRFYFLYNQSDEVLEAGQQRLKWISLIKEEYKTENIVEWLISSLKNEDLLRRYMETNQTLMWNIKDYLMGIY